MTQIKLVTLELNDILTLIREKNITKDNVVISSSSSFLSIITMLEREIMEKMHNVKSSNT
jgi:hypothetical protein